MKKSDIITMPEYFDRYINLVEDIELVEALQKQDQTLWQDKKELLIELGDSRYAPEKWTIKDILQHIIDTERIMSYRAVAFARGEQSVLAGFDQHLYGTNGKTERRTVENLLEELHQVRLSTIYLFESFDDEMLQKGGVASSVQISVLAIGFMLVGHQLHHLKVMEEHYFPLKG